MNTLLSAITVVVSTLTMGSLVLLARMFGVKPKGHGVYYKAPRWWAHSLVKAAGIKIVVHNPERIANSTSQVYVANHVSWYDTPVLLEIIPPNGNSKKFRCLAPRPKPSASFMWIA